MDWQANPTDDAIEAVIQHATSNAPYAARSSVPLRDTRTQLFVGNVLLFFFFRFLALLCPSSLSLASL